MSPIGVVEDETRLSDESVGANETEGGQLREGTRKKNEKAGSNCLFEAG